VKIYWKMTIIFPSDHMQELVWYGSQYWHHNFVSHLYIIGYCIEASTASLNYNHVQ